MADPGRLDELKRKFEENPRRYFAPLANEYRKGGDVDRAIELCRTYLPQQPTHMSGYIVYGQALYDAGRSDEAAQVFQQALSLDPENIIALRYLGDIARTDGDTPGALRWYGKVLELDPRNEEIAGHVAELSGTPPEARRANGPERPVPPTVRPEPEPDGSALALEDLISEPDRPQSEIQRPPEAALDAVVVEESLAIIQWPTEEIEPPLGSDLVQPAAEQGAESMMDFGLDEAWPAMGGLETSSRFVPPAEESHGGGGGHGWEEPHTAATESEPGAETVPESTAELISENVSEPVDHVEAEAPVEAPTEAPVATPTEEPGVEAPAEPEMAEIEGEPLAGAVTASGADESPLVDESEGPTAAESPFVTETMAELYVSQGLHADALAIYRQLVQRRDEPRIRERIAALEAQLPPQAGAEPAALAEPEPSVAGGQALGETVRDFFARIGERRPQAVAHIGAEDEAGLGRIFGGASLDAGDVSAAESLAGAFTSAGPGDGSRTA